MDVPTDCEFILQKRNTEERSFASSVRDFSLLALRFKTESINAIYIMAHRLRSQSSVAILEINNFSILFGFVVHCK